ncbi:MAG: PQQ-binding-like beta-propeller repeat protein [Synergistaceae bacterium]|nr:PQQ-binding-like beta-propeller repeat protein [Synergistaceae bacterium]
MKTKKIFILSFVFVLAIAAQAAAFGGFRWTAKVPSVSSGLAVHQNLLVFGDTAGTLHALNRANGHEVWRYNASGSIVGTPSFENDKVVFATADANVICLNVNDGSFVWKYSPPLDENLAFGIEDSAVLGGGMTYFTMSDRNLYALNSSGQVAWKYRGGDQGLRTAPVYADGLVFLGEYDGVFSIINAKSGKRENGGGAGGAINTPALNGGNVYYSSWDGTVQAVQIKSVIPLWSASAGDPITTSPVVGEGVIVVGTGRGRIVAFNEKTGDFMWNFEAGNGSIVATPIIAGGKVIAASEGGQLFSLDLKNGRQRDAYNIQGLHTDPAYADNTFYFAEGGTIYAIGD